MLPLSYGLEVIHFLEHHKTHGHHRHYHYHQHQNPLKAHESIRVEGKSLGDLVPENHRLELKLDFSDISTSAKGKTILNNVFGSAESGKLLAIMGPSGSGKTSLLNALSGRVSIDRGAITLNGRMLNKDLKRHIALAQQQDLFMPNLTLGYTLEFHAKMRMPSYMSDEQKKEFKDRIISIFNLENAVNTRMGGTAKRGLSGGELKRANIACEMFSLSSVLLIDEPTTGLDSFNALNIIQLLKEYAEKNKITVVVTVHQPSSKMFQLFDKLLLLAEGKVAYFGDRKDVISKFEALDMKMEGQYNPADFIVDQLYNETNLKTLTEAAQALGEQMEVRVDATDNGNHNGTQSVVKNESNGRLNSGQDFDLASMHSYPLEKNHSKWQVCYWKQLYLLTARSFKEISSKNMNKLNWFHSIMLSLVTGMLWFHTERTENNIFSIMGWGFFSYTIWLLNSAYETMVSFPSERAVINRERASGMYPLSAYFMAKMIGELPSAFIFPSLFLLISYPLLGAHYATTMAAHWAILMNCILAAQSVGLFAGAICSDMRKLPIVCSLYCFPTILFGGYYVSSIHPHLSWLRYASTVNYAFKSMQIVEFHYGSPIMCAEENSIYDACHIANATSIPPNDIFDAGEDPLFWLIVYNLVLLITNILFRLSAYLGLKYYKSPTRTI